MSRRLRVAVITGEILPWESDIWSACHRAGMDVTLIGKRTSVGPAAECAVRSMRPRVISSRSQNIWWLYPHLAHVLAEIAPDVIHVHSEAWGLLVQQALFAARRLPWATVCAHGADNIFAHGSAIEQSIRRSTLRLLLPRLGGYASWNSDGVRLARTYGLPESAAVAVLPGVAYFASRFPPVGTQGKAVARAHLGLPESAFVVGFVGRLVAEKGVQELIEAAAGLSGGDLFLAIWGDGPLRAELELRLVRSGVAGRFGGWLPFQEVPVAMSACDAIAIPSYSTATVREQFSRVGLEAMLSRRAIVATRTGAFHEVFGEAATLVPERDPAALGEALRALAEDDSLRADFADRGYERALATWEPERLVEELVPFWETALDIHGSRGRQR